MPRSRRSRRARSLGPSLVRAAYRLDLDEETWLTDLVERATEVLGDGFAAVGHTFDATDPARPKPLRVVYGRGTSERAVEAFQGFHAESPYTSLIYERGPGAPPPCQTISGSLGTFYGKDPTVPKYLRPIGAEDVVLVVGLDPTGYGVALSAPLRQRTRLDRRRIEQWSQAAAHMAAAFRLRRRLEQMASAAAKPLDAADAIFSPRGRLEYARPGASPATQARLRDSVRTILDAWKHEANAPEEALGHWRALEHGQWSVVDTFDTDGKRYLVARSNEPAVDGIRELTPRERQIVGYVALGHSLKLISYELGLSGATVSYHLARASQKVGARSRAELVSAWLNRG